MVRQVHVAWKLRNLINLNTLFVAMLLLGHSVHFATARSLMRGDGFSATSAASIENQEPRDSTKTATTFDDTVWPIFRENCLPCHCQEKSEGDLQLDSLEKLNRGGHSGLRLIGENSDSSELYRRIVSRDDDYRMPPEGESLTVEQSKSIANWIDNGAVVESGSLWREENRKSDQLRTISFQDRFWSLLEPWLLAIEGFFAGTWVLAIPFAIFLVAMLVVERWRKRRRRDSRRSENYLSPRDTNSGGVSCCGVRRVHYLVIFLLFVVVWMGMKSRFERARLTEDVSKLRKRIEKTNRDRQLLEILKDRQFSRFEIQRPKHPPRLGGDYFRGNDERDPRLFNGGFYRTAKMSLRLVGSQGQGLERGSQIDVKDVFVELEIERANLATTALFTESIMNSIFLSRQRSYEDSGIVDVPQSLRNVVPGKVWLAKYPIKLSESGKGTIYLYSGVADVVPVEAEPHYGIVYDLQVEDGRISDSSQLWMGSIHNSLKIEFPSPDKIPLTEWFDFRPIPEIESSNSSDPELLGLDKPDHSDANTRGKNSKRANGKSSKNE